MKTYETKIKDESAVAFLRCMNASFGSLSRKLFVSLYANPCDDGNQLKRDFQKQYGVSSTHYNSLKNHVDGVYDSRKELGKTQRQDLKTRVKNTIKTITKLEKSVDESQKSISRILGFSRQLADHNKKKTLGLKSKKPRKLTKKIDQLSIQEQRNQIGQKRFKIHQKKRRLARIEEKLSCLEATLKEGLWAVCFGTRDLLKKQNFLEENGYANHEKWKDDWEFQRSNQSFWLGDSTEKGRNRNARLSLDDRTLRLTVPEHFRGEFGSFVTVKDISFHDKAEMALGIALSDDPAKKSPISYRILERQKVVHNKDGTPKKVKQFYLQASVKEDIPEVTSRKEVGSIGVDLNSDHLAIGEIDRYGNPIQGFHPPIEMEDKPSQQITAQFGNYIRDIVLYAKSKNKPIAVEQLDFQKKKAALRETCGRKMARLLSSFAYQKFMQMIESRCQREGVKLVKVNPAFSSVLGAYNYFGLAHLYSSHQMAGFILARRGLGFKDSLKCVYNERNHTTLLQTVSIAPDKAPPSFDAWIKAGGKRHRWSLLRRYYVSFSLFVKHLGSKPDRGKFCHSQDKRSSTYLSPPGLELSLA